MKGLLLKDWYMTLKYCKAFFLIIVVFAVVSSGPSSGFLLFYPVLLASILPSTLLSYDERFKWQRYADTMPYTRKSVVSAKYILMLLAITSTTLLEFLSMLVKYFIGGGVSPADSLKTCIFLLCIGVIPAALMLPILFKFGVEKGRLVYFVSIGIICGLGSYLTIRMQEGHLSLTLPANINLILLAAAAVLLAISWLISIKFYQKREL